MLPGTDGIELMEQVPELADLPVIFISGYGRDETVARALESGAADYIVKPFSPTELTARVGAALRRTAGAEPFAIGALAIDYERRRVSVAGRTVALTATEYELLRILSVNAGAGRDLRIAAPPGLERARRRRHRAGARLREEAPQEASATTRRTPATSSPSAAPATACRSRARAERNAPRPQASAVSNRASSRLQARSAWASW